MELHVCKYGRSSQDQTELRNSSLSTMVQYADAEQTPQVAYEGTKAHHVVRGKMLGGSSAINYLL